MDRGRLSALAVLLLASVGVLWGRLFQLQVVEHDKWALQSRLARTSEVLVPYRRGALTDRHGVVLAEDEDTHDILFEYRAFRRGHPLGQLAHIAALVGAGEHGLLHVWSDPDLYVAEALAMTPQHLAALPTSRLRGDARFYLGRIAGLSGRVAELQIWSTEGAAPFGKAFDVSPADVRARLDAALGAVAGLEAALAWPRGRLLTEIERRRRLIEAQVAQVEGGPEQRRRRRDLEMRGHTLERRAPYTAVHHLSLQGLDLPGFSAQPATERRYPGSVAAHVVGWVRRPEEDRIAAADADRRLVSMLNRVVDPTPAQEEDLAAARERLLAVDYRRGENMGYTGIEAAFEEQLRGRYGWRSVERDRHGRAAQVLAFEEPQPGGTVATSLDAQVQAAAEDALGGLPGGRGALVVMDARTGECLALATVPTYRQAEIASRYTALAADPGHPLHHRSFRPWRPPAPGSTFKLVTAAAALELDVTSASETWRCKGSLNGLRCNRAWGHGQVDLVTAIEHSCNVVFYDLAQRVGYERLAAFARDRFGVAEPTGIEIPEVTGDLRAYARAFDTKSVMRLGIGQAVIEATPLQVARLAAVIANGGLIPSATLLAAPDAVPSGVSFSADTMEVLRLGMARSVDSGTASSAALPPETAGKTGTAEVGGGRADDTWFVGLLPRDDPRLVICVYGQETGGGGGSVAAPVAARLLATGVLDGWLEARR